MKNEGGPAESSAHEVHAAFESPIDGSEVEARTLRVQGWAFDPSGPFQAVLLLVGDSRSHRPRLGVRRTDIGEAFPSVPHAAVSGFECNLDLRGAQAGPLKIALLVRTSAGVWQELQEITVQVMSRPDSPSGRRARAAFTIVQNEPTMLPLWLDYYSRYFEPDDLYVLDHDSSDASTAMLDGRCHVIPVHRSTSFDHYWLRETVEKFQAFLLQSYETVLFAEVDEFVVANPTRYSGLDHYIDVLDQPSARCMGFNVVHQPDEPALRFDAPILRQRRYWHASTWYCKRLLSRTPLRWSEGFHEEYSGPDDPPDPDLLLVHLHRVDHDWCAARHRAMAARKWNAEDVARGDGAQNRLTGDGFEEWFRHGMDTPRELIPDHIRAVL